MDKQRVFAIYSEVLDSAPDDQPQRIRELCEGDAGLEAEVRSLVDAQAQATAGVEGRLEGMRNDYWRSLAEEEQGEDLSGRELGRWRLQSQIGRGGLATVYRAERADGEFSQTAAFKVLRRGLDTEDLINRFRTERDILASLNHPGIAGILDGGTLPDGRPFLVLEFVEGEDIVQYARSHKLTVRQRLDMLKSVAYALHHAHQRLIVHRDVKPSNVMVNTAGEVRLLDFGIAQIVDPSGSPMAARLTRTGVLMLTPAYGTPEQYRGAAVTTASDVYQLGLLMGEVLTGARPAEGADLKAASPDLANLHDRDLIAIIEKATRPEPDQRYLTTLDVAADIDRYLERRPVHARAGSWRYRAGKFIRRRPLLVPGAVAVMVAVAGYLVTITLYSRELERERTIAQRTQDFMIQLFDSPNPRAPADPERGRSITVVEALDIGKDRLLEGLAEEPELDASLSRALSAVYAGLDQFAPAIELRERALKLEEAVYGAVSALALESMRSLSRLYAATGNNDKARAFADRQLRLAEGLDDPGAELGLARYASGEEALRSDQLEQGETLLESAIEDLTGQESVAGRVDTEALMKLLNSAAAGDDTASGILTVETMALDTLGPDSPDGLVLQERIAGALRDVGDLEAARSRYEALIPRMARILGENHPDTLATRNNLGTLLLAAHRPAESEAVYRDLLERNLAVFGPDTRAEANTRQNLGTALSRQSKFEAAIAEHEQAYSAYVAVFDASHFSTALPLISQAYARLMLDQPERAEAQARAALDLAELHRPDSAVEHIARCLVGAALKQQGRAEGERLLAQSRGALVGADLSGPYAELCGPESGAG